MLYTSDIPTTEVTKIGTFADDTAIFATEENPAMASSNLQAHLNLIGDWLHRWKIKVNESKSAHVTFALRKDKCPSINLNQVTIQQQEVIKYLGLHLDSRLNWKHHITKKRKQIDLKFNEIKWLIGRKSYLTIDNKLLIYKAIIRPIWTYGIELWGCASKSHIAIMQRCQSKILRAIADAPWYVSNHTLHSDLKIPYVRTVIADRIKKHYKKLEIHPNTAIEPLLQPTHYRRLRRTWPNDLQEN